MIRVFLVFISIIIVTFQPILATAGSGDVLTGMIVSFLGQGVSLSESAILGVYLHGVAGDLCFQRYQHGLIASDIIDRIPSAVEMLLGELP